jgi:uncharacterized protein
MTLKDKHDILIAELKAAGSILIGFSGGVDSSFLLYTANRILGEKAVAVTARSSTSTSEEFDQAAGFVRERGIHHIVIDSEELLIPGFSSNPPDRCYHCKKELFGKIRKLADEMGIAHVADGTNAEDVDDYRPGMKAAAELGVISPLKQAGLTKADIRQLSREAGLETWDKPAAACLASRFPYGSKITAGKLSMVEMAERYLRQTFGIRQVRVRHHGEIARIEVSHDEMHLLLDVPIMRLIAAEFHNIGFTYTTLDMQGYRTGSMNETLDRNKGSL